jgi:hypothetical protein
MASFKKWLLEDLEGKSVSSSGVDMNPIATNQAATAAFQDYSADKAHTDDLQKMSLASGNTSIQKAIQPISQSVADYSPTPAQGLSWSPMDLNRVIAREYFPQQKIFMKKMMRKMMSKKMGKK